MNSKSKEDFASIIKNTLLCKRRSPLEFYYKLEQIDDPQHTNPKYTALYTVADAKSCSFKGYLTISDTDNFMAGLNMTVRDKDNDHFVVLWNFSIYDAVQDAFICLGRSKFDAGDEQDNSDQISISLENLSRFSKDNTLLLKWTVDIINIKENGDDGGQNERRDYEENVDFDLSLESMIDFVSRQTYKFEESNIMDSLNIIKKDIDSCRKQQESNEDKLQSMEAQVQQVDVRLTHLLDRILSTQPLIIEPTDSQLRSGPSIDTEIGDVLLHTNSDPDLCHVDRKSQLQRSRSEPELYRRSLQVSCEQMINNCDLKLSHSYTSPLSIQLDRLLKVTPAYINLPFVEETALFDWDFPFIERFRNVDDKRSNPSHTEKTDTSNYEIILFIGFDFDLMRNFISALFGNNRYLIRAKWSKTTLEHLRMQLYVIYLHHPIELRFRLTRMLSEDKDLQSQGFHACIVIGNKQTHDIAPYCNETFLRKYCIFIYDYSDESFLYSEECQLSPKRKSLEYKEHFMYSDYLYGGPRHLRILLTIESMRGGETFKISQLLCKPAYDLRIKVEQKLLNKRKKVEREKSFDYIQTIASKGERIKPLTDYLISLLEKYNHFERHDAIPIGDIRKVIDEDITFLKEASEDAKSSPSQTFATYGDWLMQNPLLK
ncbi:hypothetical protein Btru_048269 [Bulinus truncatus]|nr:hypothetical protein Btru_048269 [Bulinus truncatus]